MIVQQFSENWETNIKSVKHGVNIGQQSNQTNQTGGYAREKRLLNGWKQEVKPISQSTSNYNGRILLHNPKWGVIYVHFTSFYTFLNEDQSCLACFCRALYGVNYQPTDSYKHNHRQPPFLGQWLFFILLPPIVNSGAWAMVFGCFWRWGWNLRSYLQTLISISIIYLQIYEPTSQVSPPCHCFSLHLSQSDHLMGIRKLFKFHHSFASEIMLDI